MTAVRHHNDQIVGLSIEEVKDAIRAFVSEKSGRHVMDDEPVEVAIEAGQVSGALVRLQPHPAPELVERS